jgi:hypothetical protein
VTEAATGAEARAPAGKDAGLSSQRILESNCTASEVFTSSMCSLGTGNVKPPSKALPPKVLPPNSELPVTAGNLMPSLSSLSSQQELFYFRSTVLVELEKTNSQLRSALPKVGSSLPQMLISTSSFCLGTHCLTPCSRTSPKR